MSCQVSGQPRSRIHDGGSSKKLEGLFIRNLVKSDNLALVREVVGRLARIKYLLRPWVDLLSFHDSIQEQQWFKGQCLQLHMRLPPSVWHAGICGSSYVCCISAHMLDFAAQLSAAKLTNYFACGIPHPTPWIQVQDARTPSLLLLLIFNPQFYSAIAMLVTCHQTQGYRKPPFPH
jgi:hypothetical protein